MDGLEELTLVFPNPGLVWLFHQPGVFVDEPRLPENVSSGVFYLRPKKEQILAAAAQSCPTLCDPIDSSPPGFSAHGIFQARILEWVAISSSRGSSRPRDQTCISCVSCIGRQVLYHRGTWESLLPEQGSAKRAFKPVRHSVKIIPWR